MAIPSKSLRTVRDPDLRGFCSINRKWQAKDDRDAERFSRHEYRERASGSDLKLESVDVDEGNV
jgi:hypothetical protein